MGPDRAAGPDARRAELLAAALAGELSTAQRHELDALRAGDPSVDTDLAELRETVNRLRGSGMRWREQDVPADLPAGLGDRILAATRDVRAEPGCVEPTRAEPARPRATAYPWRAPSSRLGRSLVGVAAAAVLLATGAVSGEVLRGPADVPTGPPGTLGALEEITFSGAPADSTIEASLVAHTWGTETKLRVDGVPVGATFEVVLVSERGEELTSGTFLGAAQTVTCQLNAAVLREDVTEVVIERADGSVLATSSVPSVSG